ncbi:MAG: hypothetical protein H6813_04665 [Phycisphaeraceae bacterium]|nr:hypothetical protein [Phycisphaeraceae bacterium]MCB9847242.1 hypothetical protein [Phycisphaeraceae bacterium]
MKKMTSGIAFSVSVAFVTIAAFEAQAVPTGAHWVYVPNRVNPVTGELTGLYGKYCTADLYVDFEPGDTISSADFGIAGPNAGISTDGLFYQVDPPFGSDSLLMNLSLAGFHPTVAFDTAVAFGDAPPSFAQPMNWSEAGVSGAWFNTTPQPAGPSFRLARITVSIDSTFLGGQIFVTGDGPNGPLGQQDPFSGVVNVPNFLCPSPGAGALFGLAGMICLRRRR